MDTLDKYYMLKTAMEYSYEQFCNNPTKANSNSYGMDLNNFRDFCVEVVDRLALTDPMIVSTVELGGIY